MWTENSIQYFNNTALALAMGWRNLDFARSVVSNFAPYGKTVYQPDAFVVSMDGNTKYGRGLVIATIPKVLHNISSTHPNCGTSRNSTGRVKKVSTPTTCCARMHGTWPVLVGASEFFSTPDR